MELTQENLNLDEKEIELMEEVNYNLVEKEKGLENECDEDDDSRVFVLDESALETAKTIFGLQNLQDIQDDVAFVKVKEHNTLIKEINKGRSNEEIEVEDNLPTLVADITVAPIDEIEISLLKYKRHKKSNEELEILQEVFNHPTNLPKEDKITLNYCF
nr:2159_t:CDS:2 [Entrophospora candida]